MKLRYAPLQTDVLAVEEQGSEHHAVMASAEDVDAMPCVCCGLHSQAILAAAAVKAANRSLRVVYLMTDHGSLPLKLSELAAVATDNAVLHATVTCGQAFGGDLESVNLYSGLIAARHVLQADVAVISIGPGVTGTATAFGHGGVAQGEAINAATAVGGRPVAALRLSFADERPRHRVVSHHTLTALTKVALAPAFVAVPVLPEERAAAVEERLATSGVWERHVRAEQEADPRDSLELIGVPVKTMGRGPDEEPEFFAAACAAGLVAARLAEHPVAEIG